MDDLENLVEAVKLGDPERVRSILDLNGQLVHRKDSTGATALHYAALYGHRQVAELLIQRGADINSMDDQFGATPAGWAVEGAKGEQRSAAAAETAKAPGRSAKITTRRC